MIQVARLACATAAALVAAVAITACSQVTGPSLTVSIETRQLAPSSTAVANADTICCCHVRGTVKNTSSIPVHVDIRFHVKDSSGNDFTALDWVRDIPAGGSKPYDAAGIIAPCKQVTTITNDPLAYGLYSLPN
ncbi:MAG TPA: FxLYD domain-containing protein [Vicinamibacterales bacterium]|jgi:hypothetical protein